MKFDESKLEAAIIQLLEKQGYAYLAGAEISRQPDEVLIKADLREFLNRKYKKEKITPAEIDSVIRQLENLPASDLYDSNKQFCKWLADGFPLKREDKNQKDLYIQLLDYSNLDSENQKTKSSKQNIYRIVNQLEIEGKEVKRIPDAILYINGLPLVVFEFKSSIRADEASIHQAYLQLTTRYRRDIPKLFVYNALCVISDGVNNKMGSLFAPYDFFYGWRKVTGDESVETEGINSLHTMLEGLFNKERLKRVMRDFIFFPDVSNREEKIVCRYPQFYAVNKLYSNIKKHRKPIGDGKGGTYFGATGCGKSFTMQFLTRRLMKSLEFESPTIVLITDRTDLDDQLSKQFTNAKNYIGDSNIVSVESRDHLRELLKGRNSGGVFLTTIHKFTEDTQLLTDRSNVICISDEAHRSQINLDQKVKTTKEGVKKTFGFAKYLHDSLPNATYVGFTGTPIDGTLSVFGEVVDSYTMRESVEDEITVRIVYEGRAAKIILDNSKLEEIEKYYEKCAEEGSSEYQIEESKKATASMENILADPDRIRALAQDFAQHYQTRIEEGASVKGKALLVSSSREAAWLFYQELKKIRPEWFEIKEAEEGAELSEKELKQIKPIERVKMVMTRGKDDKKELYDLLGTKEYRKELDKQFKNAKSNFKIAIVVDMWLTGFDVPFLDTIYIVKPVQRHNLIQTISRVNRKFEGKDKGLVVDYIGIKSQMNQALAEFSKGKREGTEIDIPEIGASVIVVRDCLNALKMMFHKFDSAPYFTGDPLEQLDCLNHASEFVLQTETFKNRFMALVKRLKAAYDVCCGSEELSEFERDQVHFYLAVRSIVFKLTKGEVPDTAQMNARVKEMIAQAIQSDGVEEIFKLDEEKAAEIDIFNPAYLDRLDKIRLPNTKVQLLQKLLKKALDEFKKTNQVKAVDFSKRFNSLVEKYNERKEEDTFTVEVHEEAVDGFFNLIEELKTEINSFEDLGISLEEKAFYDILKQVAEKYQFEYQEERLLELAKKVKEEVDDKAKFPDWNNREDIKAELRVKLIMLLAKNGYPPVSHSDVYKEIFEQAENFKKYQTV